MFVLRAAGFISAVLTVRISEKYCNYHQCLGIGTAVSGIFLILFSFFENISLQGLCIYFYGFGYSYIIVFVSVCIIESFKGPSLQKCLLFVHGSYAIGGLFGPLVVYLFELDTFLVFGLGISLLVPFLWRQSSPEKAENNLEDSIL